MKLLPVVSLVSIALLLTGCGDSSEPATEAKAATPEASSAADPRPALTVTIVQPRSRNLPNTLLANGNVAAWQEAIVGAEVNGLRLAAVHVNVGDKVERGQELARFADETVRAEHLQAQANYEFAKAEANRVRSIRDESVYTASQRQQFFTQEKVAQALYDAATVRLAATRVLAPDDGVISSSSATVGSVVGSGQELFRLLRQGRMEWRAEVTPQEIGRIRVGQTAEVNVDTGQQIEGRVRAIAPAADPSTRNILVYVDLPQTLKSDAGLKANTYARGRFILPDSTGLTVPARSVVLRDGHDYVFAVDAQNRALQRKVTTGRRVGEVVEILEGLQPNERVVAQGAGFLNDGDVVKIVDSATVQGAKSAQEAQ